MSPIHTVFAPDSVQSARKCDCVTLRTYVAALFHTVMHICVEKSVSRTAVEGVSDDLRAEILNRDARLGYNNVLSHASQESKQP